MRKLKLDIDALEVTSFEPESDGADASRRGTVRGNGEVVSASQCGSSLVTLPGEYTCDDGTCHYSCYDRTCRLRDSCDGTCNW